jgi:GNAT superfamily N-acetyltransferase
MIEISRLYTTPEYADMEQIRQLYFSNGWIEAGESDTNALIEKIITRTYCFAVARDAGKIVGMGRAIADGVSDAYIQDVTVFPDYRKHGIGGKIVSWLVDYLHHNGISWIGLISVPGQEKFYEGQGFKTMPGYTPFLYTGKQPKTTE